MWTARWGVGPESDAKRARKKEKKVPSKRVLVVGAGQPAAGRQRANPGVVVVLLDHCRAWIAAGRRQEVAVAVWDAEAKSAARRLQKHQKKAVSRRSWLGGCL